MTLSENEYAHETVPYITKLRKTPVVLLFFFTVQLCDTARALPPWPKQGDAGESMSSSWTICKP